MKGTRWVALAAIVLLTTSAPAAAADKAHQQLMAEIRMLQEQQQQLQQVLGSLSETLKAITAKIDDQNGASRKAFADQKLLVDSVAEGVRVLREKSDDTNVRLSSMTQELEAVRQAISSMPSPSAPAEPGTAGAPGAPASPGGETAVAPPGSGGPPLVSPQRMFDNAVSDYAAGQYDLAIQGFSAYISSFPKSDKADDAQLYIGQSLQGALKYQEAVEAYQKVINDYPAKDSVPVAYFKLGLTYESLKQIDLARKAFETLIQKYPGSNDAVLAKTRLDSLNRRLL